MAAERQDGALRVEAIRQFGPRWAIVATGAASRERLVHTWVATVPGGALEPVPPPGTRQRSDRFLSGSGSAMGLSLGVERRLTTRLRARALLGADVVVDRRGNLQHSTTERGANRLALTIETGIVSMFLLRR